MRFKLSVILIFLGVFLMGAAGKNIYDIKVAKNDGKEVALSDYKGKVLLVVNTASACGYTPQYKGLEAIYQKYQKQGLTVLAFPSNDFGKQEPGSDKEIKEFCELKYKTTFPLFKKIDVVGEKKQPLYKHLTETAATKGEVQWNFEKFLIDRNGNVVGRYLSKVEPESKELTGAIEKELEKK
jgi:glutathione peroxidase